MKTINRKLQTIINDNLRKYFKPMSRQAIAGPNYHSVVALNSGSKISHELKKTEIVLNCLKDGNTVITEGVMVNNARPDICVLDLETPVIYEVMDSETDERCDSKDYIGIRIIKVKINDN